MDKKITRRDFLKTGLTLGAATAFTMIGGKAERLFAQDQGNRVPDLVAVRNGMPDAMFDRAIEAIGEMTRFVKRGNTVVVKPNIAWYGGPETGANTNPLLVKRIIVHCFQAGARRVYVFDHSVSYWKSTYSQSGIEQAAREAGASVVPANSSHYYQKVRIPGASMLKSVDVHELIPDCDVLINVPVLKHHSSTRVTIAMKNLLGVIWDRQFYHRNGLHQCIAEFCLFRKPDLNVVDAYRVIMRYGPSRAREEDIELKKTLLLSPDIVAVDTAASLIHGTRPQDINFIKYAAEENIGTMDLDSIKIERIVM